ncbi:MAG: hypothetical protein WCS88_02155 [Patescibacteria group bacterium]|jgi:hypothetical protein
MTFQLSPLFLWWEKTARPQLPLWWAKLGKWQLIAIVVTLLGFFISLSLTDNWWYAIGITAAIVGFSMDICFAFWRGNVLSSFSVFFVVFCNVAIVLYIGRAIYKGIDVILVILSIFLIVVIYSEGIFTGLSGDATSYGMIASEIDRNLLRLSYTVMFMSISIPILVSLFLR